MLNFLKSFFNKKIEYIKKDIFIKVKSQFEGYHYFPNASKIFDPSIAFLENPHRHIFYVSVKISTSHTNREVEYILFKRDLEEYLHKHLSDDMSYKNPKPYSCEMICQKIYFFLSAKYDLINRQVEIEVSEDQENSSILTWSKEIN